MRMNKSLALPALALGLALAGSAAVAQPAELPFSVVDANGDRSLDVAELTGAFGQAGMALLRMDQNGDGSLSKDELRTDGQGTEKHGDDPNGDEGNAVSQLARTQGGQAVADLARTQGGQAVADLARGDQGGQERAEGGRAMGEQARQNQGGEEAAGGRATGEQARQHGQGRAD